MPPLSAADYREVLEVVRELGETEERRPFSEPVLAALRRLVPCDVVAFHEALPPQPAVAFVGEPLGAFTAEMRAAEARYWRQDGLAPAEGARKISDFLSRREFHRLEFYEEVARPLGVEDMMRLWLDPQGARLEFDRSQRDFSEHDRGVLDVLLPHLKQFWRRAASSRTPPRRADAERLTPREREILGLVAKGRTNSEIAGVLWISPGTVRKHLENAYEKLGVHTRTAAVAALLPHEPEQG